MNENIHPAKGLEGDQFLERLEIIDSIVSKFRRQAQQLINLRKKVDLLTEEVKRLEVNLKTSSKEINLSLKNLRESSTLFTEAAAPDSDQWKMQYELRKAEDAYQDLVSTLESFEIFSNIFC